MSRSILNENNEINVYLTRAAIEATLPVLATQVEVTDPISISLAGLSGFTGQAGKIIKVNTAENALEYADTDTTTETNFGTAVAGGNTINLGNSQGTSQSVPLVLNFSGLTFKSTSGASIATFTPVSNTCNMTLNGGIITTATLSTNTVWQGNTIGTIYGGTGLTSYTTGDILYASGTNTLAKLAIGTTGQVLKVSGGVPAWGTDGSADWTVSGANIYPTTATQLLVNTTTNANNRNLLVNGDGEIQGNLSLSSTTSEMQINSNSSTGIYFNNAASSGFKFFADNGNFGCPVVNALSTNSGWLMELRQAGTKYYRFTKGSQQLFSNNGGPDLATLYFIKESNILYGNYIENDFTNSTFKLRNYGVSYDDDFMLVNLSTTNRKTTTFNKHAEFKISAGSGSNGDCTLVIEADTDNSVETSNPIIHLRQDGGVVNAYLQLSDNELSLGGTYPGENTTIYTNGGTINMSSDSGSSGNVATLNATLTDIKSTSTKVVKLQTNTIEATNQSNNIITSDATYGWVMESNNPEFMFWLRRAGDTGTSIFPILGNLTGGFQLHMNNVGDAFSIYTDRTAKFYNNLTVSGETTSDDFVVGQNSEGVGGDIKSGYVSGGVHAALMEINNGKFLIDTAFAGRSASGNYAFTHLRTATYACFNDVNTEYVNNGTARWNFRNFNGNRNNTPVTTYLDLTGGGAASWPGLNITSDDRLKTNEEDISNATQTLMKLRPQKYDKALFLDSEYEDQDEATGISENTVRKEFGFIAQEIYYQVPELRDLVNVPHDATVVDDVDRDFTDIQNDPDYSNWGGRPASVDYNSLIALLTKGFQEQQTIIQTQQDEIDALKEILARNGIS